MRYPASEKLEIIRLVERSHLPVRRTLDKLGLRRARVASSGPASPQGGPVKPRRPQGTPGKTRRRAKDRIASIRSGGAPPASPEDTLFEVVWGSLSELEAADEEGPL